jgi:hypothetical protein
MDPMKTVTAQVAGAIAVVLAIAACSSDAAGPKNSNSQVSFNVATRASALSAGPSTAAPDSISLGNDTIVLDQVELVLRDVEFRRQNHDVCDSLEGEHDSCEEFQAGPVLIDLPLGAGATQEFVVTADSGIYDRVELKLHKPEDDGDDADLAFIAAHPDFANISIRVTGTFNGTPFTFTSDLNADQEFAISPPLVVNGQNDVAVTLMVDVSGWFVNGGSLIDPAAANKGGGFENQVKNNIESSFDAFHDDNHDGHGDDD